MPILQVAKYELEQANLTYLIKQPPNYSFELVSEMYYWDTSEKEATLCLLAGIGRILDNNKIDKPSS